MYVLLHLSVIVMQFVVLPNCVIGGGVPSAAGLLEFPQGRVSQARGGPQMKKVRGRCATLP
jgi:hypothetical protein